MIKPELPSVTVMLMFGSIGYRNDAAVGDFADRMLELNGSVIDMKIMEQAFLDITQDALAHRRGNVGDGNVA